MPVKKSWEEKLNHSKPSVVKKIDKSFADIPANSNMLIATPLIFDAYVQQIPKGVGVSLQTIRNDLALENGAEYTCPLTTGIFLRIVAETAYERFQNTGSLKNITPFWRAIKPGSPLAKKLSFGQDFIIEQRKKEKITD